MNGIEAIQQQQIYRVNPVNLFERREQSSRSDFANIFANQSNYNLNHPAVAGSPTQARNLDLLA